MKKFFGLLALVLGMVSCQNGFDDTNVIVGGEQEVTINVTIPEAETRANSAEGAFVNVDFTQYTIRYIFAVYYGETCNRQVKYSDNKSVAFDVRLVPDRDYQFVVWADVVEQDGKVDGVYANEDGLHYDTSDLKEITLKNWDAMDETRDAFTGVHTETNYTGSSNITISLTRPFAKLRVVTTDMVALNNLGIMPTTATVEYKVQHYNAFNALAGSVIGDSKNRDIKHENFSIKSYGEDVQNGADMTLFTDYFFAQEGDVVKFEFNVYDKNNDLIKFNNFNTDIAVKRNHLTTIKGNVLTDGNNIKVEVENGGAFVDTPINVVEYSGYINETITLASGSYIFRDLNINTTNDNAIIIEENANVTIDIVGSVNLTAAKEAIKVSTGATLTINGLADTRSSNRAGKLVVKATNGSAISGNVTINNLAGLTAIGNGDHAFGIGGTNAEVTINNTKVDYVAGGHVQPLFENDEKYGKSEPEGGAAIGGAKVNISNSTIVKAEGGSKAAAIGNSYWNSTEVVINNSQLGDIFGGNASAAIGGSRYSSDKTTHHSVNVAIENSTITNAVGGQFGAGIGSGYDTHCLAGGEGSTAVNDITIKTSTITAQGGKYAAGIGTGFHVAALTGSIDTDSEIVATSGEPFYKSTYTFAQHVGYGVIDPAREGAGLNVTFNVKGDTIEEPAVYTAYFLVEDIDELNAALANVVEGTKTIVFGAKIEGTATVAQIEGANIIIDGNNHKFDGTLYIHGRSRHTGTETLTIKNINFESDSAKWFIDSNSTTEPERYAHNVTIKDCTFTNLTGDNDTAVCGARFRQAYKVTIDGCEATDTFYLAWFTGCSNIAVENCTATNNQEGITFGAGDISVIKNSEIQAELFGVRLDPTDKYAHNVTIENCTLNGFIPVSARNLTEGKKPINVTFNGENTLTKGEDSLYDVVFSANEYKSGVVPVGPVSKFNITGAEGFNVYGFAVAKIGNTEYTSIDEAIAAWTNNSTLTLLSDVTLSDVIKISSTEMHTLDLGKYIMTAASGKDAIEIINNGRSSASYALDIKADATNPGGITATSKAVVKTTGKSGVKDRPIIRFYNGVYSASNVISHSGSNGTNCPQFQFHNGVYNANISANRALIQIYGGTFNGRFYASVDSSAYMLISGGKFKYLDNLYGSALNADKFTIGSTKGAFDRGVYVDDEGYFVVGGAVITEFGDKFAAKATNASKAGSYLQYSSADANGLYYTNAAMAIAKHGEANVTVK